MTLLDSLYQCDSELSYSVLACLVFGLIYSTICFIDNLELPKKQ